MRTRAVGSHPALSFDEMGEGELVVLLHGIGGNKRNWHDNMPALAKQFHVVAWDARGWGESEDYEGPLSYSVMANDLLRLLDFLGEAKAHLVGLSMGGRILQEFAPKNVDRIASLTLCATTRGHSVWSPGKEAEFFRLRRDPLLAGATPADIARPVAESLVSARASREALEKLIDSMSRLHKDMYIKALELSATPELHGDLDKITVPTLVMAGADDHLTTIAQAREIVQCIPGAELVVVPDSGHLINIERPAEFDTALLAFLNKHRQAVKARDGH